MRARTALAVGASGLLLLTGCAGTSPDVERREALNDLIAAANAQDADAMRMRADTFIALLSEQSGTDLPADEVARLQAGAEAVKADADLVDQDILDRTEAEREAAAERERREEAEREAEELRQQREREAEEERQRQEQEQQEEEDQQEEESASPSPSAEPTPSASAEGASNGGRGPRGDSSDGEEPLGGPAGR